MTQTIFFGFWSGISKGIETRHDRMEIFTEAKTLRDLFNWLEVKRKVIESENSAKVVLVNFQLLTNEQKDKRSVATDDAILTDADKTKQ